ncbi:MAG TPA: AAA family ATPase [bacterium]
MYERHWGLSEKPFESTPDWRYFFGSAQHREAYARMLYAIRERKGAAVMAGVFGCGKTAVARLILHELNQERYRAAYLANPRLDALDLLRMILHELGVEHPPAGKADVLMQLGSLLRDHAREGRETVIVIDEAHVISDPRVFEELRLLLNFQDERRFFLTLLLLGQPELSQRIDENKAFEQRIGVQCRLLPLSEDETRGYIEHRLRVAGHAQPERVFAPDAARIVFDSTGGVPRRINRLCDICLLAGAGAQAEVIGADLVANEVRELVA